MIVLTITRAHGKNAQFTAHTRTGREIIRGMALANLTAPHAAMVKAMHAVNAASK
jgi:hypothetical protein